MQATSIKYAVTSEAMNPRFKAAFEFLKKEGVENLEPGRYDIIENEVFANVQEYDTVAPESKDYEAHIKYHDIQAIIAGEEAMLVAPLPDCTESRAYDDERDVAMYKTEVAPEVVALHAGEYAVVVPEDAHKPGCILGESPAHVKKILIKVLA